MKKTIILILFFCLAITLAQSITVNLSDKKAAYIIEDRKNVSNRDISLTTAVLKDESGTNVFLEASDKSQVGKPKILFTFNNKTDLLLFIESLQIAHASYDTGLEPPSEYISVEISD